MQYISQNYHVNTHTPILREECKDSEEEEEYSGEHKEEDEIANVDVHDSEVTKEAWGSKPRKPKSNVGHCNMSRQQ